VHFGWHQRRDGAQTGTWWVHLVRFESFLNDRLRDFHFGESVKTFVFGFEMAELAEWGKFFTATANYTSYRPSTKTLISVGQVNWSEVKNISPPDQLASLCDALQRAIARISGMKRKPRDFDYDGFRTKIAIVLSDDEIRRTLLLQ
jgi:hypothetical protein